MCNHMAGRMHVDGYDWRHRAGQQGRQCRASKAADKSTQEHEEAGNNWQKQSKLGEHDMNEMCCVVR